MQECVCMCVCVRVCVCQCVFACVSVFVFVSFCVVDPMVSSQEPFLRVFPSFEVFFLFALLSATTQAPLTTIGKLLTWLMVYLVENFHFKASFLNTQMVVVVSLA